MTHTEKIAWLQRYQEAGKELDRLFAEKNRWRSIAEKAGASIVPIARGSDGSTAMEKAIENIEAIDNKISFRAGQMRELRRDVLVAIDELGDSNARTLLRFRYINGESFEDIAERMGYSVRQIYRIHTDAINSVIL
jgi:DNA-directed RNA polymerase specialized sigma subunit